MRLIDDIKAEVIEMMTSVDFFQDMIENWLGFIRDWKTKRIKSCNFKQNRLDKKKKEYNRTIAKCYEIKIINKRRGLKCQILNQIG